MQIHQIETFVVVARAGSITRASEELHLSQPAVSAHVKAIEEELGLALFERTSRGMSLTDDGRRLLDKAQLALEAHRGLLDEAARIKGRIRGRLRIGGGANSSTEALVGRLVTTLSERHPEVEIGLVHADSNAVVAGIRDGTLDAGFYNAGEHPEPGLTTIEVARFGVYLAAPVGLASSPPDWRALEDVPWIRPDADSCCGRAVDRLFAEHGIRPRRIVNVDRVSATRALVAGGVGVGLLHADIAEVAEANGELELVCRADAEVRVLFGYLSRRADDPLVQTVAAVVAARASG